MISPVSKPKLNTQIYEEACEWLVHFRAGDADDDVIARRHLDEWLRRSPEHVRAYLEVSSIWEDVAEHDSQRRIDAEGHVARALAEVNVVALETTGTAGASARVADPRATRRRSTQVAASAAMLALLGIVGLIGWMRLVPHTYSTAVGERRSITLDDGSSIELNARSRLRVRLTERQRSVSLLEGQALFRVAKDPIRPFVVLSDDTRVRAVGTQFDVNRRKSATTVTVIEGRVGVDAAVALPQPDAADHAAVSTRNARPATEVFLDAGEQLVVTPRAAAVPKRANIAAVTAWTQQQLVFDSAPLSEVAEEFNRYNKRPIVIQDEALESFGVIGVFSSADPASLLRFLRAQPEIEVIESDAGISVARK